MSKENPGSTLRTFAWIGLGLTVVGGLGGLVAWLMLRKQDEAPETGFEPTPDAEEPGTREPELGLAGARVQPMPATEPPRQVIEVPPL